MKKFFVALSFVFVIAFVFNLVWETAQIPLYEAWSYHAHPFFVCLYASVADAFYVSLVYIFISVVRRSGAWVRRLKTSDTFLTIALAGIIALSIEMRALAGGEWAYSGAMPLIPFIHVGLSPIVQLPLLSVVTFFLVGKIVTRMPKAR